MISLTNIAVILVLFAAKPAHAYVDPGTASIAIQALIGGIAAAGIFFRHKIGVITQFFRRFSKDKAEPRDEI